MVFFQKHLRAALEEDYENDDERNENNASRSSLGGPLAATTNQGSRLVSAYDVTLLVRSRDPVADAHDPALERGDIPSHHVPSIVSVASKRLRQRSRTSEGRKRDRAKAKAMRAAEAVKSSSGLPPALRRAAGSKRFAQPAASQRDYSTSALPLLSFQNPWESFKPPTLLNVWSGLKWGLPEEYEEGGHSRYRGSGRRATRAMAEYRAAEAELGKDWADVQVQKPDWGWVDSERQTWLEGPNVEREKQEEGEKGIAAGQPRFGRRNEWQDPRAEEALDHARVTWLGHATTLLQLPPLADPITAEPPSTVEDTPGDSKGGIDDSLSEDQARQLIRGVSNLDVNAEGRTEDEKPRQRSIVIQADSPSKARLRREASSRQMSQGKKGEDGPNVKDGQQQRPKAKFDHGEGLKAKIGREDGQTLKDGLPRPSSEAHATSTAKPSPTSEDTLPVIDNVRDRSLNLLFDPIFSKRCSPSQNMGPARFTEVPCKVDDLPPIDVILLSHDHYDHSDADSLRKIRKQRGDAVHVFVGLGNRDWLCSSAGFKKSQVSELDWWDEAVLTASGTTPAKQGDGARSALRIVCTPAQHGSGRVPGGKDSTLWCSWMVEKISPQEPSGITPPSEQRAQQQQQQNGDAHPQQQQPLSPSASTAPDAISRTRWRAFFAGDTGLRRHGEKPTNRKSPCCPAFEEVARRYGTPHLFLLPISIGSSLSYLRSKDPFPRRYSPFPRVSEALTSCIHMDAEDAVQMMEIMTGFEAPSGGAAGTKDSRFTASRDGGGGGGGTIDNGGNGSASVAGAGTNGGRGAAGGGSGNGSGEGPLALAVHYGTFVRNAEQTKADVRNLRSACQRHGVAFSRTREGRWRAAAAAAAEKQGNGSVTAGATVDEQGRGGTSSGWTASTARTNGSAVPTTRTTGGTEGKKQVSGSGKGRFLVANQGETVWIAMEGGGKSSAAAEPAAAVPGSGTYESGTTSS